MNLRIQQCICIISVAKKKKKKHKKKVWKRGVNIICYTYIIPKQPWLSKSHDDQPGNDVKTKWNMMNVLSKESGFGLFLLLGGIRKAAPAVDTLFASFCKRRRYDKWEEGYE